MKLHHPIRHRLAIAAAVTALAIAVPTVAAQAATSPRAQTSGGVIQRYLAAHGSHFSTVFGGTEFPDYGLTLDGVLAMDSAGVGDYRSGKATDYVAAHIQGYISDGVPADAATEQYAGATAKALLVSISQGFLPKNTLGGGIDLVTRLKSLETPSGRFSDKSSFGDFSNAIGQSLALVSLHRAGKRLSHSSIAFLRQQQCTNGGFKLNPDDPGCTADPDATSFAVQGLLAAPQTTVTKNRIRFAIGYLKTQMNSAGGVKGAGPTNTANANSTGLAVMSFDSAGYKTLGSKGRSYLRSLRFGCAYPTGMRGAVAYNKARLTEAGAQGPSAKLIDQDLRATTQAVLGFSGRSLLTISNAGARFSSPRVSC
ncbi:MAG: hypothetical protein ABI873_02095 [Marmoricola sp.]